MKIVVTGARGFVGRKLCIELVSAGHEVIAVDLAGAPSENTPEGYGYVQADTTREGEWQDEVAGADGVVNLAGVSIFKRWNDKYKTLILSSRVLTTRRVVEALPENAVLVSASAVGYYGWTGERDVVEGDGPGDDFLARVCVKWESEAEKAGDKGARVVPTRFGIVLDEGGGALAQMHLPFKMGLGGPIGDGSQWFPWIHRGDLVRALVFCLENRKITGPVNCCSPEPVRNRELAKTLGSVLGRPAFIPVPEFAVKLVMGEMGEAVLHGQKAFPEKLLDHGFTFGYPDLEHALRACLKA
ncbi:MAG: TIGR01777 family oxidoreductase [Desulfatibacillaceae bacterium]